MSTIGLVENETGNRVNLNDIVNFVNGGTTDELIGSITLNATNRNPSDGTCFSELTLPSKYSGNYSQFKTRFTYGLLNHGGFGMA